MACKGAFFLYWCLFIDTHGGLVIDYAVVSKYYNECQLVGDKLTGKWVKWVDGNSRSEDVVV